MLKINTLEEAWWRLKNELWNLNKESPFRFTILSTLDGESPNSRYVVVRAVDKDLTLWIFTDARSQKVNELAHSSSISLLWYDAERMLQVAIRGKAEIIRNGDRFESFWNNLPEELRKPYCSEIAPGNQIDKPVSAHKWKTPHNNRYFACIQIQPHEVDILELDGLAHYRAKFERSDSWQGKWIAP